MGFYSSRLKKVLHLGRRLPRPGRAVAKLLRFLHAPLPSAPATFDFTAKVPDWPMDLNDELGDCVEASSAHIIRMWTAASTGKPRDFSDADIVSMYSRDGGYVPNQPWTDNGVVITDALDNWVRYGFAGDGLAGYLSASQNHPDTFASECWIFGGAKLGLNMPAAWQGAFERGLAWDVGPSTSGQWAPGSWGGHDVPIVKRIRGGYVVVTWGGLQTLTDRAIATYCDEAYVMGSWDWCAASGTPSAVAKADLLAYWASLGGAPLTPAPVPPVPPSPPVPPVTAGIVTLDLDAKEFAFPPDWTPARSGGSFPCSRN